MLSIRHIDSGASCKQVSGGGHQPPFFTSFAPFPPLPYPSLPSEVGPLIAARRSGKAL